MQNRLTSRRRPVAQDKGRTTPVQGETTVQEQVPRLPHEHDESSDSQQRRNAAQREVGAQAHADLEDGLVDTDRGPVMDKTYNNKVKPGAPAAKFNRAGPSSSHR